MDGGAGAGWPLMMTTTWMKGTMMNNDVTATTTERLGVMLGMDEGDGFMTGVLLFVENVGLNADGRTVAWRVSDVWVSSPTTGVVPQTDARFMGSVEAVSKTLQARALAASAVEEAEACRRWGAIRGSLRAWAGLRLAEVTR